MMFSTAEENYLKTIYKLQSAEDSPVPTGALAGIFGIQAPSVTEMVKRLAEKKVLVYEKSKGVKLTDYGRKIALSTVRKHRIWETFLVNTLEFGWEEVHDLAEQLEHVHSDELTNRLDAFLGFPRFDPHGDPIPDINGNVPDPESVSLQSCSAGQKVILMGIKEDTQTFIEYLNRLNLGLGVVFTVHRKEPFDQSLFIHTEDGRELQISARVSRQLSVSVCSN